MGGEDDIGVGLLLGMVILRACMLMCNLEASEYGDGVVTFWYIGMSFLSLYYI